ncbi:hypothetical protein [Corynebacterium sanguinis]|uniref:hypothetical protein n=1 Tax=Corynebacterium sanguinis TaxID=2594913 RepID=UPI00223BBD12|nr:hypothetical protein [Corynebacterium sanguinis]MCT1597606.1 hypothetical protein [Corynebacterium sanguinis]
MDDQQYYDGSGRYDRETVLFFDVAHEGAQLRAVAEAAQRLDSLRAVDPRSVVVIATDQISRAAAQAVVELRAPLRLPVVVTPVLPSYVGPLDVVVIVGDAAEDDGVSRALITASARGAETVLAGPARGPLLDDAPDATLIIPALPTSAGTSPLRAFGVLTAVLDALEQPAELISTQLQAMAEDVDEELVGLSPQRDEAVNAARQLRAFAFGARVIHTGFERCGAAVASVAAQVWSARSMASGFVEHRELDRAVEQPARDIFHDPFIDGEQHHVALKVVVWNQADVALADATAQWCEPSSVGEESTVARLIVRALAATAMDEPA